MKLLPYLVTTSRTNLQADRCSVCDNTRCEQRAARAAQVEHRDRPVESKRIVIKQVLARLSKRSFDWLTKQQEIVKRTRKLVRSVGRDLELHCNHDREATTHQRRRHAAAGISAAVGTKARVEQHQPGIGLRFAQQAAQLLGAHALGIALRFVVAIFEEQHALAARRVEVAVAEDVDDMRGLLEPPPQLAERIWPAQHIEPGAPIGERRAQRTLHNT